MKGVWCKEWTQGRRYIVKIEPGQKIKESLVQFAKQENIQNGVVVSAVGSVVNASFRGIKTGAKRPITEPRMRVIEMEGPLELVGLEGNLIIGEDNDLDCHLHIMLAKSSGEVVGGHMFDAEIFVSCEIMFTEILVSGVERHVSKTGGTSTIYIEEE